MGKGKSDSARDYNHGHKDGVDHAEHEQRDGVIGLVTDLVNDPRYDSKGSKDYQDGFKDGRNDSGKKK